MEAMKPGQYATPRDQWIADNTPASIDVDAYYADLRNGDLMPEDDTGTACGVVIGIVVAAAMLTFAWVVLSGFAAWFAVCTNCNL